jgi:tryptophanyl-tRNA synthetase
MWNGPKLLNRSRRLASAGSKSTLDSIQLNLNSDETKPSAEAPAIKPAATSEQTHEQVVTPWDVQGSVSADGQQLAINYDKLIQQFGTRAIDQELLDRFEKLTGHKPHPLLRRGTFFSHR